MPLLSFTLSLVIWTNASGHSISLACGGKVVRLQQWFMTLYPVQQHLFAVIVRDQRNMFTFRE
jgi:hypothetical protein